MWVVSIDPADKLKVMREKLGLELVNLMDPGSATIKRYGILNEQQGKIPHPATLVIDKQGIIRFLQVDENFKQRADIGEVVAALQSLPG